MDSMSKWRVCLVDWIEIKFPMGVRTLKVFGPLIWPTRNIDLQLNLIACAATIIVGCGVNLGIPIYSKKIVDRLTASSPNEQTGTTQDGIVLSKPQFPWSLIVTFIALKMVQGVGPLSLLNCTQKYLWLKVEQFVDKNVQTSFFAHVQNLSVRWHTSKKVGDVLGALETGSGSILSILEHILFSLLPTVVDIALAVIYLSLHFGPFMGISVLIQIITFLLLTIHMTERRSKFLRPLNNACNEMRHQTVESLYNFETVKSFSKEFYETQKFAKNIDKVQATTWKLHVSIVSMQILQLIVLYSGHLMGIVTVVATILNFDQGRSLGDYILLTSYLSQLYVPLNYLGGYYRIVRTNLVDLECMLEIFQVEPEIIDSSNAIDMKVKDGKIEFRNVSFGYEPNKKVLENISFIVQPREIVAVVGVSGSGKSSILKLMLRFYDVDSGEILIDGQNIRKLRQESLRLNMGVVPQDTILFNDTIKYNIKYGNLDAPDTQVVSATTRACLHEKIMTFEQAYMTMVGERGLKVSGGEKQRVGIARALLKNSPIILLDEATSSLDVHTENEIVSSLMELCKHRTCLIITHRLCSITQAHQILVFQNGRIVERGRHDQLILQNEEYARMWSEQIKTL